MIFSCVKIGDFLVAMYMIIWRINKRERDLQYREPPIYFELNIGYAFLWIIIQKSLNEDKLVNHDMKTN